MIIERIRLILHHRGSLLREEGVLKYVGGEMCVWEGIDIDIVNIIIVEALCKEHYYPRFDKIYWLKPGRKLEVGLRVLEKDAHVVNMCNAARKNEGEIEIFFTHPIEQTPTLSKSPTPHVASPLHTSEMSDGSDDYESAEDSAYRPSPCLSDEDDSVVKKKSDKGKGIAVDSSKKMKSPAGRKRKGRDCATGSGNAGTANREHEQETEEPAHMDEDNIFEYEEPEHRDQYDSFEHEVNEHGGNVGHRDTYTHGMSSAPIVDPEAQDLGSDDEKNSYESEELKTQVSSDDEEPEVMRLVFPQFNEAVRFGHVNLEIGMEFATLETFKKAVRDYTIHLGREVKWVKNDKVRARGKCKVEGCPWTIFCAFSSVTKSFQIKTFNQEHTCARGFKNISANTKWVMKKLEEKLRSQPTLTHLEAFNYMKQEFGVHLNDSKIFRSMREARKLVEGDEAAQYAKLWDYAHELLRSNPGSNVKMDVLPMPEGPPQFQRFYVCLEGCKRGFLAGCRPFIGLDGAFLKGYFGGQVLAAVAQDANMHIFPLAYAIVDVENKDNWKWFLTLLHQDIGDYQRHGWNFMSDMQKGLIPAMQEVMPGVPHRFCAMHLWKNFTKQWKDLEMRGAVWQCAKSTTVPQFNANMESLKLKNDKAWAYLNKFPPQSWTKAYFNEWPKCDNITNNNCEVFNAKIVKFRGLPILTMAEEVRCYIMKTMANHKIKLAGYHGRLPPLQQSRLEVEKKESNMWTPIWSGDGEGTRFEVQSFQGRVDVDLAKHTCTCRFWQLTGMPCHHAVAAIAYKNQRPEDYCHSWLTMGAYNATYEHFVQPTESQQFWEKTNYDPPVPPIIKRSAGRPKKQRRRDGHEEPVSGNKLKRVYANIICSRCGLGNHNSRTCTNVGVPPKPKNWAPPTTENEQSQQDEVDLSQGVPNSDPQESQPTNIVDDTSAGNEGNNFTASTYTPAVAEVQLNAAPNVVGRNTTIAPTPIQPLISQGGVLVLDHQAKGCLQKNPPYRPPGLVTKAVFRHKMKTLRPPSFRSVVSPQSTPTEPLAPSQGVIQPSSQTSGEQPMTFIPTPRGPPPQPK